tara:strand:- start:807 stop:1001 length:195 start_codon:yes stop_codon:yes gene_type:complete
VSKYVEGNQIKSDEEASLSGKELDWLLRKLSEVKILMAEMDTASRIWRKLSNKHKEIINEQHKI